MEFSVPTNFQKDIISGLVSANIKGEIKEVYGKLAFDDLGGGRAASALAFVSRREAEKHIKQLRQKGFVFNYLLNTLCMDNLEFTAGGQKKIINLTDWLVEIGVNAVTVASPYLAMWVRKRYPRLSISASVIANVDSPRKAQFWESVGVGKITFPFIRNFNLIKAVKKSVRCKIQLIANTSCLNNCPTFINHSLMASHASQGWHKCRGYMFDYFVIMCRYKRLRDPVNFIRSEWIRPEDISFYEKLGVDSIKLIDRRLSTDMILKIINAYIKRSYQGNLLDLFPVFQGKTFNAHTGWVRKLLSVGNPLSINIFKAVKFSGLMSRPEVNIDNRKLNGFLENIPAECGAVSCGACGYCEMIAGKSVVINESYRKNLLNRYKTAIDMLFRAGLTY